jgi:hypothetical protein
VLHQSHAVLRGFAGLLHASGELSFIELVVLVGVEVARVLALGLARGTGRNDVPRKKAKASKLTSLDSTDATAEWGLLFFAPRG